MWGVESRIQDRLRLISAAQDSVYISYFQVSSLEQANVFQTLEYSLDRVIIFFFTALLGAAPVTYNINL